MSHPSITFIKDKVKQRRRELKISQEDMAVELNMSKENYAKYERRGLDSPLYLGTFLAIAEKLEVPPTYLLPSSDPTKRAVNEAKNAVKDLKVIAGLCNKHISILSPRLTNYD
ncbi:MAG: hypothetical protein CMO36_02460 [Verrucomicrobiaceae bacterium]|nr:hypothetical protein [Verrucomicrobiaceae bacterium]|tara:strand:- start:451 stop:789 length:339 start_codon:yes stop_codon:yes gene_type:complete